MRILELCLSPDFGGLEIHVVDFCFWLAKKRDVTLFVSVKDKSRLHNAFKNCRVPKLLLHPTPNPFPVLKAIKLARFIKEHSIEVVHIHWKKDLALASLAKILSFNGFHLVHTRHMSLPGKKRDLYHRFVYKKVDCFIATTKRIERQAKENLPLDNKKILQVYLGVKPPHILSEREKEILRKRFHLTDPFTIGLFGRITEFKGQHILIEAVNKLKNEGLALKVVIVGHSMDPAYLDRLKQVVANKKLQNEIIFIGFYQDPTALMQCVDILVLTTIRETFGLVLIEGMHAGVPVIGSDAGGVPEIIDHGITGMLFQSENAESLANSIKKLYGDQELRSRIAAEGKKKAEQYFNAETQYNKVIKCLSFEKCN